MQRESDGVRGLISANRVPIILILVGLLFTLIVGARTSGPGSCPVGPSSGFASPK